MKENILKEISVEGIVAVGLITIAILSLVILREGAEKIVIGIGSGLIGFLTSNAIKKIKAITGKEPSEEDLQA